MYESGACLTMEAGSRKSPTENDQLGTRSGSPRAVMAYLGCCCHLLLFIEPQPLRFVEEEEVLCVCALPTHQQPPPSTQPCFFPWGRQPCLQSLQAVCLRWAGCCVSTLGSSVFRKPPAPLLPACLPACLPAKSGSVLQWRGGTDLCYCSLGHCPSPVYLSVYLSALVCQLVCPSFCVTLPLQSCGPRDVCPAARLQNDTGLELKAVTSSHTLHY